MKLFSLLQLQMFLWDACQDKTLVILMLAAAASLALGIKTEVGSRHFVKVFVHCQIVDSVCVFSNILLTIILSYVFKGLKEGWYDGGSIALAVIIVIIVTGIGFT